MCLHWVRSVLLQMPRILLCAARIWAKMQVGTKYLWVDDWTYQIKTLFRWHLNTKLKFFDPAKYCRADKQESSGGFIDLPTQTLPYKCDFGLKYLTLASAFPKYLTRASAFPIFMTSSISWQNVGIKCILRKIGLSRKTGKRKRKSRNSRKSIAKLKAWWHGSISHARSKRIGLVYFQLFIL